VCTYQTEVVPVARVNVTAVPARMFETESPKLVLNASLRRWMRSQNVNESACFQFTDRLKENFK